MVSVSVECCYCGSVDVVRNGRSRNGKQVYKCKACGRGSRESPQFERYTSAQKEMILRAYQERPSMRGIGRIFGVSRSTLSQWLKKRPGFTSTSQSSTGVADHSPSGSGGGGVRNG